MSRAVSRAPRNRTLSLSGEEKESLQGKLLEVSHNMGVEELSGRIICGDFREAVKFMPDGFVDLLILDPPYNLDKDFNGMHFKGMSNAAYMEYLESLLLPLLRTVMTMFLYRAASALLQPLSDSPLCRALGEYGDVFSLLFIIQLSVGAMFLVLVAQVITVGNLTVMLR
jgi:site-specific DNA-methyltransferase (adenine-specific)